MKCFFSLVFLLYAITPLAAETLPFMPASPSVLNQFNPLSSNMGGTAQNVLEGFNPLGSMQNDYSGIFSNHDMQVVLQQTGPSQYSGNLTVKGKNYNLQAMEQNGRLSGNFQSGTGYFPFTAYFEGTQLILNSGGNRHALNPKQYTGQRPTFPPQAYAADESADIAHAALGNRIGLDLNQFATSLRYWLSDSVSEQEAASLVETRLIPQAAGLAAELQQLQDGLRASLKNSALPAKYSGFLGYFAEFSSQGSNFFNNWVRLLQQMLELSRDGDQAQLKALMSSHLPYAIKQTLHFSGNFIRLSKVNSRVAAAYPANSGERNPRLDFSMPSMSSMPKTLPRVPLPERDLNLSLKPSKMLQWQTFRNMSEVMRDGMRMLRDIQ